jgi:hypothetical protein
MRAVQGRRPNGRKNVANNLARFWRWTKNVAGTITVQKRTEITIETDQVVVIRRHQFPRGWCPECGREVEMVSLQDALAIAGVDGPRLLSEGADQNWHFCDEEKRAVCVESVLSNRKISG